jgi:hypothetical protein
LLKVFDGLWGLFELLLVKQAALGHRREQTAGAGVILAMRRCATLFVGHFNADVLGQCFNGLDEIHVVVIHQKADGVAVLLTAKAVIKLFLLTD